MIGGDKAAVDDVVPADANPLTFQPTPAQSAVLRSSGLVLEIGGRFEPGVEQAAAGATSVLKLGPKLNSSDPYIWLDPATMQNAVGAVASAMAAADPAAASLFQRNAGGVVAQVQSMGIDFSSTFSACPGTTIVTPDNAFSALAAAYGLHDQVVGPAPTAADVSRLVALLSSAAPAAAITEPWVDDGGLTTVAAAGHLHVHQVDTLAGVPADNSSYFNLMEKDLGQISSALGCSAEGQ
jgi:ABC-type Zn uptake system ZnuABC Zn-binding protein ZnuA